MQEYLQKAFEITVRGYKEQYLGFSSYQEIGMPLDERELPLMQRWYGIGFPIAFLVLVYLFQPEKNGKTYRHPLLTAASFTHNIILMLFSMSVFYFCGPVLWQRYQEEQHYGRTLCAFVEKDWDQLGFWAYLFYLSKYYEYIDCFLVIMKNKKPLLLQTAHHAGASLLMWGSVYAHSHNVTLFVVFNSFIHSLMYLYYALTALRIYPPTFIKFIMTFLQLMQFFYGVYFSSGEHFLSICGLSISEVVLCSYMQFYVVGLFVMFSFFAYGTYFKKADKSDKPKKLKVD